MNTVKLLTIAVVLNGIAVILGVIFMFSITGKHNAGSLITSLALFLSMMAIRASMIRRQKIETQRSNSN